MRQVMRNAIAILFAMATAVYGQFQVISNGITGNDNRGEPIRDAWTKVNANFASISTNLNYGTNGYWQDTTVPLLAGKVPASANPTFETLYAGIQAYQFDKSASNCLYIQLQLPHGLYPIVSNCHPHIHWTAKTPATNVIWGMEYLQANYGSVFTNNYDTLYCTGTLTTAYGHTLTAFPFLTLTGGLTNGGSQIVLIKIFRPNDGVAVDVFGLSFDPHVLLYRPGTFTENPD